MYKTLVLLVCFCCFLTSCRTTRQDVQKSTSTTETIIQEKETYRDTVLYTPKAETSLKIPVSDLVFKQGLNSISKPKTYTQKNGNATAKIKIQHDTITLTATCDSLAIVAKIKQELQREVSATARSDVENSSTTTGYSLFHVLLAFIIGLFIGAIVVFILKTLRVI